MDKSKILRCAAFMTVLMFLAGMAVPLLGTSGAPEQKTVARTQEVLTSGAITVIGPTYSSNQYTQIVSAGQYINYNLSISSGSTFDYADLNITWQLETDWNTSVQVSGKMLTWVYYFEADRWINVTVTEKANSSNTATAPIYVQVIADLDVDGLPDTWERKYFGSTAMTDGTGDADGDGWTDAEEYQNETDPLVSNPKPGFLETYSWLIVLIAIVVVVLVLLLVVIMPKMKSKRADDEKKKIAAAVEVEKSLLGLDELEDKPKK